MTELPATSASESAKVRLLSLSDLDGRTAAAKSAKALVAELESDLGGAERLSAAERALVVRAAVTTAMVEHLETVWLQGRGLDVGAYCALVNVQRRAFTTLGLERRPRDVTPDLSKYIAERAAPAAAQP